MLVKVTRERNNKRTRTRIRYRRYPVVGGWFNTSDMEEETKLELIFQSGITRTERNAILDRWSHKNAEEHQIEWVSVKESLPEIGKEVAVYCPLKVLRGKNVVTSLARYIPYVDCREIENYYWNNFYGESNWHAKESVTHWRDLPVFNV